MSGIFGAVDAVQRNTIEKYKDFIDLINLALASTERPQQMASAARSSVVVIPRNSALVLGAQVALKTLSILFEVYAVRRWDLGRIRSAVRYGADITRPHRRCRRLV